MQPKPCKYPPRQANTEIQASEEQLQLYSVIAPHYRERVQAHPSNRWLKSHYDFICKVLETGKIGSYER